MLTVEAHFSIGTNGAPEASYRCALAQSLFKKLEPALIGVIQESVAVVELDVDGDVAVAS